VCADIPIYFDTGLQEFDILPLSVLGSTSANSTYDLAGAVYCSLFTDGVAPLDYVGDNIRGVWFDTYEDDDYGSLMWLLYTIPYQDVIAMAIKYTNQALGWLVADNIADALDVSAIWYTSSTLLITINITEPQQTVPRVFNYSYVWSQS
jgi:phage gp46-like protein